ncbi:MAG: large subunit ribosomal protein [Solirubrobacteraceae bacterium]|jgi:large subunit ribosomal protein L21|nr:large subunit ribosomal protein [Solirubrobacteraceae bacterium]
MAYAIVKTGGKQYRVEQGQTLLVERLPEDEGATVALEPLLFRSTDTVFDADGLKQVSVKAKIVGHERGEKIRVFKFKPKRGYKRTAGHRQELTRLEITEVMVSGDAAPRSARAASDERGATSPAEVTT